MKHTISALSIILALSIALLCCGCGGKKATKQKQVKKEFEDTYDDIETDASTSDNGAGTGEGDNGGGEASGGDSDTSGIDSLTGSDYKKLMDVPSRANCYKLTNTYNKLKNGDAVKVGYYGGSVTSGTGASKESTNSWRALTTSYIKSIAKGKVSEVNAALGGTASYLGAARFDFQIIYNKL